MSQLYSFPVLKPDEILQCLREMQIQVDEDDLEKPSPAVVKRIYETFVETIMGITKEEMSQPAFQGLSALSYPELHEESIPSLAFMRAIMKLMAACGVHAFSLKDLTHPDPKTLRRYLSGAINFAKFREERMAAFSELTLQTEQLHLQKSSEEQTNAELTRRLQELESQRSAEEPALSKLRTECAELESEINRLNKEQAVLRHETSEMKQETAQLRDEAASKQFLVMESQKENQELRGKIINSPERFKKEISNLAHALEETKEEVSSAERRLRGKQAFSENIARTEKDVTKTIAFMEEIENDMKRCKIAKHDVKSKKAEVEFNTAKAEETKAQRHRVERLMEQKLTHAEDVKQQGNIKLEAVEYALKAGKEELRQVESEQHSLEKETERNARKLAELEEKRNNLDKKHNERINEMRETYKELESAIKDYNVKIVDTIRATQTTLAS